MNKKIEDVLIIGGGISGTSIFRELTKYNLSVTLLERENDLANGATKANSAIVHAGYDAKEGSLMAKYNALGNEMYEELCKELDVPFKRTGSFVVAYGKEQEKFLEELYQRGITNNIKDMEIIDGDRVRELEPNLSPNITGALHAKTAGIVGPWELTIALAENGVENGGTLELNSEVINIEKVDGCYKVTTKKKDFYGKVVVNASGVYGDVIHNMISKEAFKITPRRGQYFVMDKTQGDLVDKVIFQCPTELGKGVLITPTVHGNLLLGPDAEDLSDREDISTTSERLEFIKDSAVKVIENVSFRESIRNFAGLRAESDRGDFVIEEAVDAKGFIDVAGIKSPGLTAAPAIAVDVVKMVCDNLEDVEKKKDFKGKREQVVFMELSPEEKKKHIKENPLYGKIVCRCENITEGEIVDAIRRPAGGRSVDGIKKRCRPGMGRCQGGFCGPIVQEILARELGVELEDVILDREGSYILTGETK